MPVPDAPAPEPPDGIRPAQLGVVMLRRVILGDISATLVDLSLRHLVRIDEPRDGTRGEWLVSPLHTVAPRQRRKPLLRYEEILLDGLSRSGSPASLPSLAPQIPGVLEAARAALIRDAVDRGWLRRLHREQRTKAGEELATRIRAFQHGLRRLATERGEDALTGHLLPYALRFGMVPRSQPPLATFARHWIDTFAPLPGWRLPEPKRHSPLDDPVPINNDWPGSHWM